MSTIFSQLFKAYPQYCHELYKQRRVKHVDFIRALEELAKSDTIDLRNIGKSVQGRPINLIQIGNGDRKILFWSQMHGDEATATMALLDMFRFFTKNDQFDRFRLAILSEFSLYFIPVLNPDGMEVYERRNAIGIDMNRDVMKFESPESKLLKTIRDDINPEFGFNLHDQDTRYTVGNSPNPATISFLAPPIDANQSIDNVRLKAMQLIGYLYDGLQNLIPGQVAKYTDEFEPRAFGDNMQKWGTSTVLVEAGGYKNDPEKQQIRKLHFVLLLSALAGMHDDNYKRFDKAYYNDIPFNGKFLFDLLLRNVQINIEQQVFKIDIGINKNEVNLIKDGKFYYHSEIEDIGDLSAYYGYQEVDCEGLTLVEGKCYSTPIQGIDLLDDAYVLHLLEQGFTHVLLTSIPASKYIELPINILSQSAELNSKIVQGANASFLLNDGNDSKLAIINGFVYDFGQPDLFKGHGLWQ